MTHPSVVPTPNLGHADPVCSSEGLGGRLEWGTLYLCEAARITKHRSQIGIYAGTRLHSHELGREDNQSFRLSLVSGACSNPAMTSRYSASSSELKLRQIQGLVSRRSKAPLLTSKRDSKIMQRARDTTLSSRYKSIQTK